MKHIKYKYTTNKTHIKYIQYVINKHKYNNMLMYINKETRLFINNINRYISNRYMHFKYINN